MITPQGYEGNSKICSTSLAYRLWPIGYEHNAKIDLHSFRVEAGD